MPAFSLVNLLLMRSRAVVGLLAQVGWVFLASGFAGSAPAHARVEYVFGRGDVLKITVFKHPDLATEARVSGAGTISFPLVGAAPVAGLTPAGVEKKVAQMLLAGAFVGNPQVNVLLEQTFGNQVSVLGQVNHRRRYPTEGLTMRVSDMLSMAGGIAATGDDEVIVSRTRDGRPFRKAVDIVSVFQTEKLSDDIELSGRDTLFVNRPKNFHIYGEVERPDVYRLERPMTLRQALVAAGGGASAKGTAQDPAVYWRTASGKTEEVNIGFSDRVQDADVIYVKERVF